jgi:hypothetical protein
MLWLYNKDNKDNIFIDFYQVFIDTQIEFQNDSNTIYSLESTDLNKILPIKNIDKFICSQYTFTIRIIDQLISYIDNSNEQIVFSSKMNFIAPSNNKYNLPIFNFTYKKVNNNRMPNLIETNYNFYDILDFKIYKISDKIQFIIETNPKTKIIKKYFITANLDLISDFIKK